MRGTEAPPALPADLQACRHGLVGRLIGRNRGRRVVRVELEGCTCYAKFFHHPKWGDLLRNFCTAPRAFSQAEREWRVAALLVQAGLMPVTPVAYGHRTVLGLERESLFVSRETRGPTLGQLLRRERAAAGPAWSPGPEVTDPLVVLMRTLLHRGIYLPDISLEHILVPTAGAFRLLDLHNGRRCASLGPGRTGRMLGRLWAGARDTVRPARALRVGSAVLAGFGSRRRRRRILTAAAARGIRWERRERRKRPEEADHGRI